MEHDSDDKDEGKTSNWLEIKRHRNRVNSQRTRNRERDQLESLTHRKSCLHLSNTAIQYQNMHMREAIRRIREHLNRGASAGATIPVPSNNPSIGTGPPFFPHQSIPTNPSIIPSPHLAPLQQQQQIFQQILTQAASLQPPPQAPSLPAGVATTANQIVSIIQTELARSPMLASAMNAGILKIMSPNNNLVHMGPQQMSPPPPFQQVVGIPPLHQGLNPELSRNNPSMPAPHQQPVIPGQNLESNVSGDRSLKRARSSSDGTSGENKDNS